MKGGFLETESVDGGAEGEVLVLSKVVNLSVLARGSEETSSYESKYFILSSLIVTAYWRPGRPTRPRPKGAKDRNRRSGH